MTHNAENDAGRRGPIRRLRDWWKSIEGSALPDAYDDDDDYLRWQR